MENPTSSPTEDEAVGARKTVDETTPIYMPRQQQIAAAAEAAEAEAAECQSSKQQQAAARAATSTSFDSPPIVNTSTNQLRSISLQ